MNSRKPRRDDDKKSGGRKRISSPKKPNSFVPRDNDTPKRNFSSGDSPSYEKRPYTKRTEGSGDRPFTRRPSGDNNNSDNRSFSKRTDAAGDKPFTRKPYGDRNNDSAEKRPYTKRTEGAGDKPFTRKPYGDRNNDSAEKRPYTKRTEGAGDKPFTRKPYGDRNNDSAEKRPYTKRTEGAGDQPFTRKPYGDRNNDSAEKRPYTKRTEGAGDKPFTRKPYGDRNNDSAEKRPYTKRTEGAGDQPFTRKPYGDRNNDSAEKRPYTKRTEGGFDAKPKFEREGGERNPEERRDARDFGKPYKSKAYTEAPKRTFTKREDSFDKKPFTKSKNSKDDNDPNYVRLNRYLSNAGICSRREADDLIISGVITVNGEHVTELGAKVHKDNDEVRYNNEPVRRERLQYILMNKPKDFITTTDDPQERRTVSSLVERITSARVYPVGRLDRNTTGVLLLTNDGDLTLKLTHPKFGITKVYAAELDKKLRQEDFIKIKEGLTLDDGDIKVDDVAYIEGMDKNNIGVQLHSGRNRIVRRIFESLGYRVLKLDRTSFASLSKKGLKRGECRFLTPAEVGRLKNLKS